MHDLPAVADENAPPADPAGASSTRRHRQADRAAKYERQLLGYAAHLVGSVERGRDLVLETFARLCAQSADVPLPDWLFVVCRNLAVDRLRKERRMSVMEQNAVADRASEATRTDGASTSPVLRLVRDDESRRAVDALGTLPPRQQEAIRLKFQQELSYAQIAQVMQTTPNNVAGLVHAGLKSLRERLGA